MSQLSINREPSYSIPQNIPLGQAQPIEGQPPYLQNVQLGPAPNPVVQQTMSQALNSVPSHQQDVHLDDVQLRPVPNPVIPQNSVPPEGDNALQAHQPQPQQGHEILENNSNQAVKYQRDGVQNESLLHEMGAEENKRNMAEIDQAIQDAQQSITTELAEHFSLPAYVLAGPGYEALQCSATFDALRKEFVEHPQPKEAMQTAIKAAAEQFVQYCLQWQTELSGLALTALGNQGGIVQGHWQQQCLALRSPIPQGLLKGIKEACDNSQYATPGKGNPPANTVAARLANFIQEITTNLSMNDAWEPFVQSDEGKNFVLSLAMRYMLNQDTSLQRLLDKADYRKELDALVSSYAEQARAENIPEFTTYHNNAALGIAQLLDVALLEANFHNGAAVESDMQQLPKEFRDAAQVELATLKSQFPNVSDTLDGFNTHRFMLKELSAKLRNCLTPVTPQHFAQMLRETVMADLQRTAIMDALKMRWPAQGKTNDMFGNRVWENLATGILARLKQGNDQDKALVANLKKTTNAKEMQDAVHAMGKALDQAIVLRWQCENAVVSAQETLYDKLGNALGLDKEQVRTPQYKVWNLEHTFKLLANNILIGKASAEEAKTVFSRKADEFFDKHMAFYNSVDQLGLSPMTAARWKEQAIVRDLPKATYQAVCEACAQLDTAPLVETLRALDNNILPESDRKAYEMRLKEQMRDITQQVSSALLPKGQWPKDGGLDDTIAIMNLVNDVLMDHNAALRELCVKPSLLETLDTIRQNSVERGTNVADVSIGFQSMTSALLQSGPTRVKEREQQLALYAEKSWMQTTVSQRLVELGIPVPTHMSHMKTAQQELATAIRNHTIPAPGQEENFSVETAFKDLAERFVQEYVTAYNAVKALPLSPSTHDMMLNYIFSQERPAIGDGHIAYQDIAEMGSEALGKSMLRVTNPSTPASWLAESWSGIVLDIKTAYEQKMGPGTWNTLRQADQVNVVVLATMAMQDKVPGLREALASRSSVLQDAQATKNVRPELLPLLKAAVQHVAGTPADDTSKLTAGLKKDSQSKLPLMHAAALHKVTSRLSKDFGQNILDEKLSSALSLRPPVLRHDAQGRPLRQPGNTTVREILEQRVNAAKTAVSPEELATWAEESLVNLARQRAATQVLRDMGRTLEPPVTHLFDEEIALALNILHAHAPEAMQELEQQTTTEGIRTVLSRIPQCADVLRTVHTMSEAYSGQITSLAEQTGLTKIEVQQALSTANVTLESLFGPAYRQEVSKDAPLLGQELQQWCHEKMQTALASPLEAISAISTSDYLLTSSKIALCKRVLSEPQSFSVDITAAIQAATNMNMDMEPMLAAISNAPKEGLSDQRYLELFQEAVNRLDKALEPTLQNRQLDDAAKEHLRALTWDTFLTMQPALAEKLALPAQRLPGITQAATAQQASGLALLHAARGHLAARCLMSKEDVSALKAGTASPELQRKLDTLWQDIESHMARLKAEWQQRLTDMEKNTAGVDRADHLLRLQMERQKFAVFYLNKEKVALLRSCVAKVLLDEEIHPKKKTSEIDRVATLLPNWDNVSLNDTILNAKEPPHPVTEAFRREMQEGSEMFLLKNTFVDNIYAEVDGDANRANYIVNGKNFYLPGSENLRQAITDVVPDAKAKRFLSTLLFQGAMFPYTAFYQNFPSKEPIYNMPGSERLVNAAIVPAVLAQSKDTTSGQLYELQISEDKKSAIVSIHIDNEMRAGIKPVPYGICRVTQELHIDLTKEPIPEITQFKIGQKLLPLGG